MFFRDLMEIRGIVNAETRGVISTENQTTGNVLIPRFSDGWCEKRQKKFKFRTFIYIFIVDLCSWFLRGCVVFWPHAVGCRPRLRYEGNIAEILGRIFLYITVCVKAHLHGSNVCVLPRSPNIMD